jgi:hypothetical protein
MVLEGFGLPSWVGWLSGILFYRLPWGIPAFKSWCEPFVLYHILIGSFANLLWADYIIHYAETFASESDLRQVITKVFTYMAVLLFLFVRVCFLLKAKTIANFLSRIELHPASSLGKPLTQFDKWVLWIALILHVLAGATFSAAVGSQRKREHSWFSMLSKMEYTVTFFIFGTFPVSTGSFLAFSYGLVTTKHMLHLFDDFCDHFEIGIKIENGEIPQLVFEPPPPEFKIPILFETQKGYQKSKRIQSQKELMIKGLFSRIDIIFHLFEAYNQAVGPFLLGLVITLILYFVQTINAILIMNLSPLFLTFDWVTLIYLIFQLVIILFNLGHYTHKRVRTMALFHLVSKIYRYWLAEIMRKPCIPPSKLNNRSLSHEIPTFQNSVLLISEKSEILNLLITEKIGISN